MTISAESEALLAALQGTHPQSRQRRELVRSLLESVEQLAQENFETLDLKIADTALSELLEAFKVFEPYRDARKVTIFGSARTPSGSPLYELAEEFAAAIADEGWMVVTGAGPGIMAAGIEGAGRERSFGVNILLPFEQGANQFIADDVKLIEMRYFFTRKVMLTKESAAFALFPGGFGTLDECFELLTLLQTGKAAPAPVVLLDHPGGHFWSEWREFVRAHVAKGNYISDGDECFFSLATSARQAADIIAHFYRNYHSLRMVHSHAVIRLHTAPTDEQLAAINETYVDMISSGAIERSDALPVERSARDVPHLPRLIFEFNRRDFGSLRRLIDDINNW